MEGRLFPLGQNPAHEHPEGQLEGLLLELRKELLLEVSCREGKPQPNHRL